MLSFIYAELLACSAVHIIIHCRTDSVFVVLLCVLQHLCNLYNLFNNHSLVFFINFFK